MDWMVCRDYLDLKETEGHQVYQDAVAKMVLMENLVTLEDQEQTA